jgi:tetratricopeptide (TPR) repeat protein
MYIAYSAIQKQNDHDQQNSNLQPLHEQGSTDDFDNALKFGDGSYVYTDLAELKLSLNDAAGALADCVTAITLNSKYAGAYLQMGLTKIALNQKPEACTDFNKAIELGLKKAAVIANRYCR